MPIVKCFLIEFYREQIRIGLQYLQIIENLTYIDLTNQYLNIKIKIK